VSFIIYTLYVVLVGWLKQESLGRLNVRKYFYKILAKGLIERDHLSDQLIDGRLYVYMYIEICC
jgi:hypothetical protein